jgi:hypothetical protein
LSVERVEADSGNGVLALHNDGPLIVGGVTAALNGIAGAEDITIRVDGDLTIAEPILDTVGMNYLELIADTVHINADILTGGSTLTVWTFHDGDLVLNATVDSAGGDVYLYADRDLTISGTLLTQGEFARLRAFGDIIFTAAGRVEAGVSPYMGWPAFEVDAGGRIMMADGSLIDARDGEINLFADGDVTISSLVGTWFVSVFSRNGSILDGGDLHPDIVSETVDLIAYRGGAVGTAANPLDLQVDELFGASVTGFYINNAGPLHIAYDGIDAGGDVWISGRRTRERIRSDPRRRFRYGQWRR